jgi:hypothetical protein
LSFYFVIPAKAGLSTAGWLVIHFHFKHSKIKMDSRFRGNDDQEKREA